MRMLWAVSSVGRGHIFRDLAVAEQLKTLTDVEIDWLAPDPAGDFLSKRGCHVLECSSQLKGSGKIYEKVFRECTDEFNLMEYTRADTRLHRHDFKVSKTAWKENDYDVIIGDEAFWLLTGFTSRWGKKPCPFIFLTDFIGTKAMRSRGGDLFTAWFNNLKFSISHMGPDEYLYVGYADEIPEDRMGFLLPGRRNWAKKHCRFIRPIVGFNPEEIEDKRALRKKLGLPGDTKIFLAAIGPEGDYGQRVTSIEQVFEEMKKDFPDACFIITGPGGGTKKWIQYHPFLDHLYRYFAASDFVIIQSGYGKVVELSALGVPFIAIPLDYHFEQEYVMAHRLDYYGVGKLVTMRDHSPEEIGGIFQELMNRKMAAVEADTGMEAARIILSQAEGFKF